MEFGKVYVRPSLWIVRGVYNAKSSVRKNLANVSVQGSWQALSFFAVWWKLSHVDFFLVSIGIAKGGIRAVFPLRMLDIRSGYGFLEWNWSGWGSGTFWYLRIGMLSLPEYPNGGVDGGIGTARPRGRDEGVRALNGSLASRNCCSPIQLPVALFKISWARWIQSIDQVRFYEQWDYWRIYI